MPITEEDRAKLGALAMQALDTVEREYGEEAQLGDACIVYEVLTPNPDDADDLLNEGRYHSTTKRTAIPVGLLTLALQAMTQPVERVDDEE
jgi:hypothetical protein